jgi:hypothetical protein
MKFFWSSRRALLAVFFAVFLCAQAAPQSEGGVSGIKDALLPDTMYVTLGAIGILNTMDVGTSAPSPILFSPGFAAGWDIWRGAFSISAEGRLSFFMSYYLWDGKAALPAEIEHRTAFVTTLLLDIPVLYSQEFGSHAIYAGAGVALSPRFCFLAWNVKPLDSGATGSAEGDVKEISTWFYEEGRFAYAELVLGWDYALNNGWRAGFDLRIYFPFGNGANAQNNPLDGGMLSLAVKICLPK